MKSKFFFFASIFLFLLLAGAVGFGWWYNENFLKIQTEKVNELNTYYENEFKEFQTRYDELVGEKEKVAKRILKAPKKPSPITMPPSKPPTKPRKHA